jgi:glycosyltransferase involved in cell wall biosynthesis
MTVTAPRISVLLPVRNAAATLPACLGSLARQTEPSWECIVVDDGSVDDTRSIAEAAARNDRRFTILTTPPRGIVAALNDGLARCRAPLIARMDGDDVMHRERLAAQAAALDAEPELAAVGCHVRLFPRASLMPRLREYEAWLNGMRTAEDVTRDAFVECPIAHPTLMMRRGMAALGYRDCGWPEDYELLLRALAAGLRIGIVARRLLAWRNGPATLSRIDARYGTDRFTASKAHYLAAGFLRGVERYVLWGYGSTGRRLRRALAAHGRTPSHIVEIKRGRLGQRIHGAQVVPHAELPLLRGIPIVISVARAGPRAEIRGVLAGMGFEEGRDFVCAA